MKNGISATSCEDALVAAHMIATPSMNVTADLVARRNEAGLDVLPAVMFSPSAAILLLCTVLFAAPQNTPNNEAKEKRGQSK